MVFKKMWQGFSHQRPVWAVALALGLNAPIAQAQSSQVWRCGNEYTNNATQARQQRCQPLQGGQLTILHASPKPSAASNTRPAQAADSQISPSEQQTRNQGARAILQSELKKAQERMQTLMQEYNDGNPAKDALGLRNPQAHLERVNDLKTKIERQRSDIESIERELGKK